MAAFRGRPERPKRRVSRFREQSKCRFCRDMKGRVDYKDIDSLGKLLTAQGKIFSRKRSGNCAKCQRRVKTAIKRARFLALLPYIG